MSSAHGAEAHADRSAAQPTALVRTERPAPPPPSPELSKAQAQHEKLLGQVKNKSLALSVAAEAFHQAEQQYARSVEHLQRAIGDVREEIKAEFEYFLSPEHGLSKKDRGKVRRLQAELFDDDDDGDEFRSGDGFGPFDDPFSEPDPDWQEAGAGANHANAKANNGQNQPRAQVGSAHKPSEPASLIRTLFRRLTAVLHPDKVQDDAERARRTAIMQELNSAYDRGDLAALLALEKLWLPGGVAGPVETEQGWIARLKRANTELRRQLRRLTAELKELHSRRPDIVPESRSRRSSRPPPPDPFLKHLEQVLQQARHLRDVAMAFRDRRLSTAKFIDAHYTRGHVETDADLLEGLLEDLLGDIQFEPPQGRVHRRPTKKTTKKSSTRKSR